MDDSCAVCAESLEWVAYGACGHREVCSTCVSRLRFICDDRHCCICKTESEVVFVTKALGDYTTTISDFSVFKKDATEGKVGSYWYHEDTGAYFDDSDHYKMVKAMCKLSCSICDKKEESQGEGNGGSKRTFRNIEQLKSHLFHQHTKFMCSLCLEGRKIFICEQKLYSRTQLKQHSITGNSEVDGSESERGGFMGHPKCEFCKKSFYGDNELYSHMSTEHYTCHVCQRQNPGQFEYYKNYDDLEMHFRSKHFLCEDEACLAKKFTVFTSESEMKRHNALEHGGHMSRSKRNAVLQIPTSFRYRRSNEQDRRGRGRGFPDPSDNQFSAIEASSETDTADYPNYDPSSIARSVPDRGEMNEIEEIVSHFESLATTDSEGSSRYRQALGSRNIPLVESSFPPLPVAPPSSQQKPKNEELTKNTMAARLRRRNNGTINVINSARPWSATNNGFASSSSTYSQGWTAPNHGLVSSSGSASSPLNKTATTKGPISSGYASSLNKTATTKGPVSSGYASSPLTKAAVSNGSFSSSNANFTQARPATGNGLPSSSSGSSSWNTGSTARVTHSVSAPNLVERGSLDASLSDFPPVSVTQKNKSSTTTSSQLKVVDVQTANKSLVERIRSALEFDENQYTAFKDLSAEYRLGVIGAAEYVSYAQQFGLPHLVPELARLCPDAQKQRELLEAYNASVWRDSIRENGFNISNTLSKGNKSSNKGKVKSVEPSDSGYKDTLAGRSSNDTLAESILDTVKKLQASYKPLEEEAEVLSKDGYRRSNGNLKTTDPAELLEPSSTNSKLSKWNGRNDVPSTGAGPSISSGGGGGSKQRKKTSKFHRVRLGDGYDRHSDAGPEDEETTSMENTSEGLPVRGVWRNGGGQKLVALTQKDPAN